MDLNNVFLADRFASLGPVSTFDRYCGKLW
jgi:hypothetical protein